MNGKILPKIMILLIFILILPIFSFAQINEKTENKYPKIPETPEEAKDLFFKIIRPLPDAMKKAWQEALIIWQKMADFGKSLWESKIKPWFQDIWQKILAFFGKEFEKGELIIEQKIEKEKQELKKEIPKAGKNIWEKLKGLFGR